MKRLMHPLDWVALALFAAGATCVATHWLPWSDATSTVRRILPLLAFLGTVVILAELTAAAEVFDVIAARLAIAARGRIVVLFLVCVAFAAVTTITLNLDTTAVLLTPVMIALGRKLAIDPLPLAMTTVWLANTASLLLPVSNLTNLLAANRVDLAPLAFAERMWLPQLAAILVTITTLWLAYWRKAAQPATIGRHVPRDRVLYWVALAACILFIVGVLLGLPLGAASAVAAGLVVAAFLVRDRRALRPGLLPWRLLVFVTGLFLVVQTVGEHGLNQLAHALAGNAGGVAGAFRAGGTGVLLANVVNNLPAYVAGEAVIPLGNHTQLLALLIGVNVGPLATPWASLATLLWHERCRSDKVAVPLGTFLLTGLALAVVGAALAVGALLL
jgi:arsenical pump membrane protein